MNQSTHRCTRCETIKSVSEFGKNSRSPSGLKSWCRPCSNAYTKDWLSKNPESLQRQRSATARWREANPDRGLEHARSYKRRHRDDINARRRSPEQKAVNNAYNAVFRQDPLRRASAVDGSRAWAAANPERYQENQRRAGALRRARKSGAHSIPFTREQLAARMQFFGNVCWMCGGAFEHVDHVKPLKADGPHILANLRPACAACNVSKSGKWYGASGLHRFKK